jgi:hypothetical protein
MKLLSLAFPVLLAALISSGCVRTQPPVDMHRESAWSAFQAEAAGSPVTLSPAKDVLSGSIRFGLPQDTRRVTYMLWPIHAQENSRGLPGLRLEVNAGAGPSVCSALWQSGRIMLLLHQEKQAWTCRDSRENLGKLLGISLPLELPRIYAFLCGRSYSALGKPSPVSGTGGASFAFGRDALVSRITLRPDGSPVQLQTWDGWDVDVDYGDDRLPSRLDGKLKTPDGDLRFLLLVKGRAPLNAAQPPAGLSIPAGYSIRELDD